MTTHNAAQTPEYLDALEAWERAEERTGRLVNSLDGDVTDAELAVAQAAESTALARLQSLAGSEAAQD